MEKIVAATNNKNKLKEIRALLKGKFEVLSLADLNIVCDVEETGKTFYENALIKAKAVCELTNLPALSDDSGLCVDALSGAPGIYSARYAGENADDEKNNDKLLKELEGITDRNAKFVSVVLLYCPNGEIVYGEASAPGIILTERKGTGGFGYDPLFYSEEIKKTFAEATPEEKNSIGHRGKALRVFLSKLSGAKVY